MLAVIFRPAAEFELRGAYDWYEEREEGLGAEFLRCVDACVQNLRRHPEMYPVVHQHVRQGILRRFPYSVLHLAEENRVVILSVFHSSRDPQIWKTRL